MRKLIIILLFSAQIQTYAQSPSDWWYFGQKAGVHFTSSGPVADTNGVMDTYEGCATVSNLQGDLLFYTDGTWVFNSLHDTMPNGDSLMGNGSSTQSSVVVPYPGNADKYYIFTARGCTGGSSTGASGYTFAYSVVDMTLDGGLGDVITAQKNIILFDSSSEKCTAAIHANGSDIWVIGREEAMAKFRAYRISSAGVIDTAITDFGVGNNCIGYMLANHSGNQIAIAHFDISIGVIIYDFDQQTGQLSVFDTIFHDAYGLHFSPNDQYLYVGYSQIFQYDLSASNIQASEFALTSSGFMYTIAEGPDEKLYISKLAQPYLAVIHNPDLPNAACNFQDSAVFLLGRNCRLGLPNHVAAGIFLIGEIRSKFHCTGDTTMFLCDTSGVDNVIWNFGDPASGASNQSTDFFPGHAFTDTGEFIITLIAFSDTLSDTAITTIRIYPRQSAEIGSDTFLCNGDSVIYSVPQPYASFLWHNANVNDSLTVKTDADVSVTVFGICDTVSDTVQVRFDFPVNFEFGPDTTLCDGNSIVLDADIQVRVDTFFWNTADTLDSILVTETGFYRLEASNACGVVVDSITVTFIPVPGSTLLPPDTLNCFDNEIVLTHPGLDNVTYVWSDSTTKKTYTVDTTETVWLAWYNECGFAIDTFTAIFNGEIRVDIGEDTTICEGDSIRLTATWPGSTYVWNTGDTTDTLWTLQEDKLYVVTITYNLCSTIESRRVDQDLLFCPTINCALRYANVITPNGDGLNDRFRAESDCDIYRYEMRIYNRWGQQVHHSTNISYGWDGFIEGAPAADGVYYFMIDFKDNVVVDEDQNVYRGNFELIRD